MAIMLLSHCTVNRDDHKGKNRIHPGIKCRCSRRLCLSAAAAISCNVNRRPKRMLNSGSCWGHWCKSCFQSIDIQVRFEHHPISAGEKKTKKKTASMSVSDRYSGCDCWNGGTLMAHSSASSVTISGQQTKWCHEVSELSIKPALTVNSLASSYYLRRTARWCISVLFYCLFNTLNMTHTCSTTLRSCHYIIDDSFKFW